MTPPEDSGALKKSHESKEEYQESINKLIQKINRERMLMGLNPIK